MPLKEPATGEAASKRVLGTENSRKVPEVGPRNEISEPKGQWAREAGCGGDCTDWMEHRPQRWLFCPHPRRCSNTQGAGVRCAQSQPQGFVTSGSSHPTFRPFSHL